MDFSGHSEAQNRVDGRVICLAAHLHPTCSLEISETFNNVDSLVPFLEILILWVWSKISRINQDTSTFQKLSSTHCLIWTPWGAWATPGACEKLRLSGPTRSCWTRMCFCTRHVGSSLDSLRVKRHSPDLKVWPKLRSLDPDLWALLIP